MYPCAACFGSRGFQPVWPWKWSLPHSAPSAHQVVQLPYQLATATPAYCQHAYYQDQVLKLAAQTWIRASNVMRMKYYIRLGLYVYLCLPIRAECRSCCLHRMGSLAKVFNSELPIIPLCSIYCNNTTWKRCRDKWDTRLQLYLSGVVFPDMTLQSVLLNNNADLWHTCLCQFCPPVWFFEAHPPGSTHLSHWYISFVLAEAAGCAEGDQKTDELNNTCQLFLFNFSLTLKTFFKKGFESILKLNHFSPKPRFF